MWTIRGWLTALHGGHSVRGPALKAACPQPQLSHSTASQQTQQIGMFRNTHPTRLTGYAFQALCYWSMALHRFLQAHSACDICLSLSMKPPTPTRPAEAFRMRHCSMQLEPHQGHQWQGHPECPLMSVNTTDHQITGTCKGIPSRSPFLNVHLCPTELFKDVDAMSNHISQTYTRQSAQQLIRYPPVNTCPGGKWHLVHMIEIWNGIPFEIRSSINSIFWSRIKGWIK